MRAKDIVGPGALMLVGIFLGITLGLSIPPFIMRTWEAAWIGVAGSVAGGVAGGTMTLAAAIIAWHAVQPQIQEARRQSAAASKMALLHIPADLAAELERIDGVSATFHKSERCVDGYRNNFVMHYASVAEEADEVFVELISFGEYLEQTIVRYPPNYPTHATRVALMNANVDFINLWGIVSGHIDAVIGRRDAADILSDIDSEELMAKVDACLKCVKSARYNHAQMINSHLADTWVEIRALEQHALGKVHASPPT